MALLEIKNLHAAVAGKEILKGISPVRGQGKYRKYSRSYRDQILKNKLPFPKKRSPVNLRLSGQMLKSIFTKFNKAGFIIGFKSSLADIHNRQGAGKSRIIRRILPNKSGEEFNKSIQVDIQKFLEKSRRQLLNKINK